MSTNTRGKQIIMTVTNLANALKRDPANRNRFTGMTANTDPQFPVYEPRMETISFDDLIIDRTYQREPNVGLIDSIVKGFDINGIVTIVVAERMWVPEGQLRFSIIEGQQRALALSVRGYSEIRCIVIPVADIDYEQELFELINKQRRAVSAAVLHKNLVNRGHAESVALDREVRTAGFAIAPAGSKGDVVGVKKLHELAATYPRPGHTGPDYYIISKNLLDYAATFGRPQGKGTVDTPTLAGFICLQDAYQAYTASQGKTKTLSQKDLSLYISKTFPSVKFLKLTARQSGATQQKRGATNKAYAQLLLEAFNASAPQSKKLPAKLIKNFGR